jgi:hypothetical protein
VRHTHPTAIEFKNAYNVEFLGLGPEDFAIDFVFFHRGLQCLFAVELKVDKFKPADLGQLSFYVEALDRTSRRASPGRTSAGNRVDASRAPDE